MVAPSTPSSGLSSGLTRVIARVQDEHARLGLDMYAGIAVAPGRVNLIGEHTDYNDGFVLPLGIDRYVAVSFAPRDDDLLVARSIDFDDTRSWEIATLHPPGGASWYDYVAGVAWVLRATGHPIRGAELVIHGDVPVGSGLSSSAAVELAVARALCAAHDVEWDPVNVARLAQRAENEFVGVQCGVKDQLTAAAARSCCAILIDCRSLDLDYVRMPADVALVVMDTGARRSLATSAYNDRRAACEAAVAVVKRIRPGIRALRDVSVRLLQEARPMLDPIVFRRALHVVSEIHRPVAMAVALRGWDLATAGALMNDSHASLRDLYDVSSRELDLMCAFARAHPGCFGACMTGAGFGGSAIALVARDAVDDFVRTVAREYGAEVYGRGAVFACAPADGARIIPA